jgi:hypothetical protein
MICAVGLISTLLFEYQGHVLLVLKCWFYFPTKVNSRVSPVTEKGAQKVCGRNIYSSPFHFAHS